MLHVTTATLPGSPDRDNEDFAAASHNAVVLLDGAGNPPGSEQGCHHGVAWYSRTLGTIMLELVTERTDQNLSGVLADAIEQAADQHRDTCDLEHPGSPASTVLVVRQVGEELQHLVLADSVLVLHNARETRVVTDTREAEVGRRLRGAMDALPIGTPEHARERRRYIETLRSYRNRPGGFWVASSNPSAAEEAVTGTTPTRDADVAVRTRHLARPGQPRDHLGPGRPSGTRARSRTVRPARRAMAPSQVHRRRHRHPHHLRSANRLQLVTVRTARGWEAAGRRGGLGPTGRGWPGRLGPSGGGRSS